MEISFVVVVDTYNRSLTIVTLIPIIGMIMPETDVNIDVLENWSDEFYPDLYCGCIEATETACFEQNIVELWGDQVPCAVED